MIEETEVQDDWGIEKVAITVEQFDKAIDELYALRIVVEEKKALHTAAEKEYDRKENEIMELLKASGRTNFASKAGKVTLTSRASYKTPKLREDKEKLFEWMKKEYGEDLFWAYVGINSQSLNSFCKTEREKFLEEGKEFKPEGLDEPVVSETLSFRRA